MTDKPKTTAARQRALRDRRAKTGHIRREYWATVKQHNILRQTLKELQTDDTK